MPQLSQTPKGISQLAGLVIVLVIAILGVGGWYVYDRGQKTDENANIIVNQDSVNNINSSLANQNLNTTSVENVNTNNINQKKYINDEFGYEISYPSTWEHEYIYLTEDPLDAFEVPIRYSIFHSPQRKYNLVIGIKKVGSGGSISARTGIGAGDIVLGSKAEIAGKAIDSWKLEYQNSTHEVFFYNPENSSSIIVGDYEIIASFGGDDENVDIDQVIEYNDVLGILDSIILEK